MFAEKDTAKSIHCRFMNGGCRLPSDEEFQPEFGKYYHDWSCCTLLITLKVLSCQFFYISVLHFNNCCG